jgi:hypothetical protein
LTRPYPCRAFEGLKSGGFQPFFWAFRGRFRSLDRPSVGADLGLPGMPELLRGHLVVARAAQAPDIGVVVSAAEREGLDMVRHGGRGDEPALNTSPAQRLSL